MTGDRTCLKKKSDFNVKNHRLWKKMTIFSFFVAWYQNLTSESVLSHHFGYKTYVLRLFTVYLRNKNIISSGCYNCISVYFRFFRHFRSPVPFETTLSARTRRFPITYKKPFDDISNLWPVIWSSVLYYLKKKQPEKTLKSKSYLRNSQKLLNFVKIFSEKNTFYGASETMSVRFGHPRVTHRWQSHLFNTIYYK